jgi:hypothetical protein
MTCTTWRSVTPAWKTPSNAIPFLWCSSTKKLILALNHNQDLTDDPAGVFPARVLWSAEPACINQKFMDIHLSFPASSAGAPMLVDLRFSADTARRPGQPPCSAARRSNWQDKATPQGPGWQAALLQNSSDQPSGGPFFCKRLNALLHLKPEAPPAIGAAASPGAVPQGYRIRIQS